MFSLDTTFSAASSAKLCFWLALFGLNFLATKIVRRAVYASYFDENCAWK
jgi:hypothetical protein